MRNEIKRTLRNRGEMAPVQKGRQTSVTLLRVELEDVSVLGMSPQLERLLSGSWMMWWPVGRTLRSNFVAVQANF